MTMHVACDAPMAMNCTVFVFYVHTETLRFERSRPENVLENPLNLFDWPFWSTTGSMPSGVWDMRSYRIGVTLLKHLRASVAWPPTVSGYRKAHHGWRFLHVAYTRASARASEIKRMRIAQNEQQSEQHRNAQRTVLRCCWRCLVRSGFWSCEFSRVLTVVAFECAECATCELSVRRVCAICV